MSARFTALVNGNPEPEFEFSFNGVPLFPTDRIHITRERSGLIRLSMAFVEESDIGTYTLRYDIHVRDHPFWRPSPRPYLVLTWHIYGTKLTQPPLILSTFGPTPPSPSALVDGPLS